MLQQWLLSFHIVGFVLWAAGLMVTIRMLAFLSGEDAAVRARVAPLEKRLYIGFAVVGFGIAAVTGTWMLLLFDFGQLDAKVEGAGFHIKLTFVVLLIGVHAFVHGKRAAIGSPLPFKMLQAAAGTIFLAIVVTMMVVRPELRARKQQARADAVTDRPAAPAGAGSTRP